jgi:hypothetical protein
MRRPTSFRRRYEAGEALVDIVDEAKADGPESPGYGGWAVFGLQVRLTHGRLRGRKIPLGMRKRYGINAEKEK